MKAIIDSSRKPYYDTTSDEIKKGYARVLSVPGKTLQNRELNVMSGMLMEHIKNIGDNILTNGTIISGCSFYINEETKKAILSDGKIYFEGMIIDIPYKEWPSKDIDMGIKILCAEIIYMAVNEIDDLLLKDPAEKYENYGEPGAHRLKIVSVPMIFTEEELKIVQSGTRKIVDLIKLSDGRVIGPIKPKPVFGKIYDYMAHRTFDELGNFIVKGLKLSNSFDDTTTEKYKIEVSEGRAYVMGYEYIYDTLKLRNKSSIDSKDTAVDEIRTFNQGILEYRLFKPHVKKIDRLQCQIREPEYLVTRSPSGSSEDKLRLDSVKNIHSVYIESEGTKIEYEKGKDWILDGDSIYWISNNRPPSGSSFYIDISYIIRFNLGADYNISLDENNYTIITFIKKPEDGSDFNITYTWYLSRYDLVYIDTEGSFKIISGVPGENWELSQPQIPINTLPVAYVLVKPGIDPSKYPIQYFNIYRVPVVEQRANMNRLDNLEVNLALTALESEAQRIHENKEESVGNLKGLYVDSFADYSRSDYNHPEYKASINVFEQKLLLPVDHEMLGIRDIIESNIINTQLTNASINNYIITLPYSEIEVDWQKYATDTIDLNPYKLFPLVPTIEVKPPYEVSIEERVTRDTNIILPLQVFVSSSTVIASRTSSNVGFGREFVRSEDTTTQTGKSTTKTTESYISSVTTKFLQDLELANMPQNNLKLRGRNYIPGSEVKIYMEDIQITTFNSITTGMGSLGTVQGNLKTNNRGEFEIVFKIPPGFKTGSKVITVTQQELKNGKWSDTDISAVTNYTGLSFLREFERINSVQNIDRIHETVYVNVHTTNFYMRTDPVAQSFWFDEDTFVTSLDLYFKEKPSDPTIKEVWFLVRELLNGEPHGPVLFRTNVKYEDIKLSPDATVPTKIKFDQPIYCQPEKEYCFVIGCDSPGYKMFFAKMNNNDILTNTLIQSQPHKGTMFTSSNNVSWSVHQDQDITFTLYRAKFEPKADLIFNKLSLSNGKFSIFKTSFDSMVLEDTTIKNQFQVNDGIWNNLPLSEPIYMNVITGDDRQDMVFKFSLETTKDRKTPVINLNTIYFLFAKYKLWGTYLMRTMEIPS